MKFDLIIGNPPYNFPRRENNSSSDLYTYFIHLSLNLSKRYSLMVIPKKFFVKNDKRSRDIRDRFIKSGLKMIKTIHAKDTFNIEIKGSCCYYINDKSYNGLAHIDGKEYNLKEIEAKYNCWLFLNNEEYAKLDKVIHRKNLVNYNPKSTFNIRSNDKNFDTGDVKIKVSKAKGDYRTIDKKFINNLDKLNYWKVVLPATFGGGDNISFLQDDMITIEPPGVGVSESFIFFNVDFEQEAKNLSSYLKTKFVKWLLSLMKNRAHVNNDVFKFIPKVDLNIEWDDEKVEREFI
jgi:site-specific DNA-methyltransferase (adenine-specific)